MTLTVGLFSVILGTASRSQNLGPLSALGVGAYIVLAGLWSSPISGASMNPARSFGPDLVLGNFDHYWVYVVGPVLGALIAVASRSSCGAARRSVAPRRHRARSARWWWDPTQAPRTSTQPLRPHPCCWVPSWAIDQVKRTADPTGRCGAGGYKGGADDPEDQGPASQRRGTPGAGPGGARPDAVVQPRRMGSGQ